MGAATGVGFQWLEETIRRLLSGGIIPYGETMAGGPFIHWEIWTLFPGYGEEGWVPTSMFAGHHVATALAAVGIGLAIRLRRSMPKGLLTRNGVWILPGFLLLWVTLDHAAWNSHDQFYEWIIYIQEDILGGGYYAKNTFLILLLIAIVIDYIDINRIKAKLTQLPGEKVINPVSEFVRQSMAFVSDTRLLIYLLLFYRRRRQLAFTLLAEETTWNAADKQAQETAFQQGMDRHRQHIVALLGTSVVLILGIAATIAVMDGSAQAACISCMFDSLADWWSNLDWWEKGLVIIGGVAIGWAVSGGFLAGLGGAMVFVSVADGGKAIGAFIRDPIGETQKSWDNFVNLTEREKAEVLGTAVISKALERVGMGFLKKGFADFKGKFKGGSGDQSGRKTESSIDRVDDAKPTYTPKDSDGNPLSLPKTDGTLVNGTVHLPDSKYPHTQIGWKTGRKGDYIQTLEWGHNGRPIKRTDWTDHGRPNNHTNPHGHNAVFKDGSWSFE